MSIRPIVSVVPTTDNAWQHIETQLLSGSAASITFSTGLAHDLYRLYGAIENNATAYPRHTFNNDTTSANYDSQTSNYSSTSHTHTLITGEAGAVVRAITSLATDSDLLAFIVGKSVTGDHGAWVGYRKNAVSTSIQMDLGGGAWQDATAKITRIDLVGSAGTFFETDSAFRLEGLVVA